MVIYAGPETGPDKDLPRALARQFGLVRLDHNWLADDDGISSVTVTGEAGRGDYIPYTNRPIRWHTDGYYNPPDRRIRAMVLHCVEPRPSGGENALLDHEIAYLLLRDADPDFVAALMQPDAMTIPARTDDAGVVRRRRDRAGLFRRPGRRRAAHALHGAHAQHRMEGRRRRARRGGMPRAHARGTSPYIHRVTLHPGMGLLCNNVLHDRSGFVDDPAHPRLIYRARYYDRLRAGAG